MSRRDICAELIHGFSQLMRGYSCADDCYGKRKRSSIMGLDKMVINFAMLANLIAETFKGISTLVAQKPRKLNKMHYIISLNHFKFGDLLR